MTTVGERAPEAASSGATSAGGTGGSGEPGGSPGPGGPATPGAAGRAARLSRRGRGGQGGGGRQLTVPARLRWAAAGCATLAVLLGAVLLGSVSGAASTWSDITGHEAPQVTDAGGLYQALTDMDAQAANQLAFGNDPQLSKNLVTARTGYAQDRVTADHDLQAATLDAAGNAAAQKALSQVLDNMGNYQDLAARALALNAHADAPAGHPDPAALTEYRQATDLMRTQLMPAAEQLIQANDSGFEQSYRSESSALGTAGLWLVLLGGALLVAMLATQIWLTRSFRRVVNVAMAAATVLTAVLLGLAGSLFSTERNDLTTARISAYDSVVALTHARAVIYDANADESRYLLDQGRAAQYQQAFQQDSDDIADVGNAGIFQYDGALASAISAYQQNNANVGFTGYFGDEFRNITFPGERAAAEKTLLAYQAYERDDRKIRALVQSGHLEQAIAYGTSLAPGGSNADFNAQDAALQALIGINENAYESAAATGANSAGGDEWVLVGGMAVVVLLLGAGAWPRLKEFR
ncbi:hypothetical protein [Streptacidiphilus fuscans]|uniref:Secreted protein n=1 Tax=Streptacidiphilus fuscans TaxID=2789292 RepID=A0A931B5L3_9ACTN|nr:hypothetical protein [Streptacidiphilus fuscans]MBF9068303.1 hypothetical protein [Streptacidiphilus fuscans]